MFNTKFSVYKPSDKPPSITKCLVGIFVNLCKAAFFTLIRCVPLAVIVAVIVLIVKVVWKS